jgi:DNA-binding NarL/FixJ family response regulator
MKARKVRIVIAEDHPPIRDGVIYRLEKQYSGQFELVGETEGGFETLRLCLQEKPDVLVLDWYLKDNLDGYNLLYLFKKYKLPIAVVLLTAYAKYSEQFTAPVVPDATLVKGVNTVVVAETIFRLVASRPEQLNWPQPENNVKDLTPREMDILLLVTKAKTDREIARELGIAEGTVGQNLRNIYNKLGATTRGEAAMIAYLNGLIWQKSNLEPNSK